MKTNCDNSKGKTGFTIIELLTVMSIIILLISLLVPALNRVRRYALLVKQNAQFHAISIALDMFNAEEQGYPPSDRLDTEPAPPLGTGPKPYCGAMKLGEAMIGQDFLGFHPDSQFRRDGIIIGPPPPLDDLYPVNPPTDNIKYRKTYLQLENANATKLVDIYTSAHLAVAPAVYAGITDANLVLCDVYVRTMATGNKVGMPILYYKANPSKTEHLRSSVAADLDKNIYDRRDNQDLVDIPIPWVTPAGPYHPMATDNPGWLTILGVPTDPGIFYDETRDKKIAAPARPNRADSYILMSAGFDNEYGTSDDVFNFGQ